MARNNGLSRLFNNMTLAAIIVATGSESLHYSEHHNPHGNRRERIAEQRERLSEAQRSLINNRNITARSGNPPDPNEVEISFIRQVRRRYGSDALNQA